MAEVTLTPAASAVAAPVQYVASLGGDLHRQRDDGRADRRIELWHARGPRLVAQKPTRAFGGESFLSALHAALGSGGLTHDRVRVGSLGTEQNDLRPPDVLLWSAWVVDQITKPINLGRGDVKGNAGSHAPDSHSASPPGLSPGIQTPNLIH